MINSKKSPKESTKNLQNFTGRILFVGFGAVAKCTLPVLVKHLNFNFKKVTIIDMVDKSPDLKPYIEKGLKFVKIKIGPNNIEKTIKKYVGSGDLLIDLAYNIDFIEISSICNRLNVLYINTSIEQWNPYNSDLPLLERTLYHRHMYIREKMRDKKLYPNNTTCVADHGANPGLISHFVKKGLLDLAGEILGEKTHTWRTSIQKDGISKSIKDKDFAKLAMNLGVKVIHDSEWDTQVTNKPKKINEFVGTWSIEGLREEGIAPVEIGWGTHENKFDDVIYPTNGPKHQAFLNKQGFDSLVKSFVPGNQITGMMIRHGENFTISEALTVYKNNKPIYRPTVYYAYCPCNETIDSILEFRLDDKLQDNLRILNDSEITGGYDTLGALIMGHKYNSWWCGTRLSIKQARKLVPGNSATTIQVAISVVAATIWMINNSENGFNIPDNLPHEEILKIATPYLGEIISQKFDWEPVKNTDWKLNDFLKKYN